jgi:DNA-binding transcriptional LysR family regulator
MQLDHLRALQAVTRFGTFSRAALHLRLTQPAVSMDLDLGVVGLPVRRRELVCVPFVVDEFVAIAAPRHWRRRGPLDAAALRGERLILDQPGATSRRLVDAWLQRRGVAPTVPAELGNTEATKALVSAGLGISIASRFSVRRDVAAGRLVFRPLRPPLSYPLGIVRRRTPAPPVTLQAVLSALEVVRRGLERPRAPARRS